MIITRHWWALVLRGVIAILFGILAIGLAPITYQVLAIVVSAYFVVDGIFAIIAGVQAAERHRPWWPFALEGIANILAGIIVFLVPGVLVALVAVWAILTGLLLIVPAFKLPAGSGKWWLILNGVISLLLGIVIILQPIAGVLFIVWSIAIYAFAFGAMLIGLGLRVRHLHRTAT